MNNVDRLQYDLFWLADHILGRGTVNRALEEARARLQSRLKKSIRESGHGHIRPVPEEDFTEGALSADDFQQKYVKPCLPVVLRGAARNWTCTRQWSPTRFREQYGDTPVQLIRASDQDIGDMESGDYTPGDRQITLADVVQSIEDGTDDYARFIPLLHQHPELVNDLDVSWVERMKPKGAAGMFYQVFMGGKGTTTSLHNAIGSNLFVEVYGRKTWWLFSPKFTPVFDPPLKRAPYFFSLVNPENPDLEKHPLFEFVDGYKVTLEPGDVLYNPPFYWHYVRNPSASIGVGIRWYDLPSILKTSATQGILTLLSTNPPIWVGRKLRNDFTKVFLRTR